MNFQTQLKQTCEKHTAQPHYCLLEKVEERRNSIWLPLPYLQSRSGDAGSGVPALSCAFKNASPKLMPTPITSPVERISGPSAGSTPGNLLGRNRVRAAPLRLRLIGLILRDGNPRIRYFAALPGSLTASKVANSTL